MNNDDSFAELLERIRAGDAAAAEELVQRYEPVLRRMVHVRLVGDRLRRLFDSEDICQSVLASFFVRVALGQYELSAPEDLLKLLAIMARNKVVNKARRIDCNAQGGQRVSLTELSNSVLAEADAGPSRHAALKDLLHEVRRRLPREENQLLELRQQGVAWADIAQQVGDNPDALRKRLNRAVDLVAQELGLDD
jgi:DNA-directed RNA polymerase specialized sigma24 family protein